MKNSLASEDFILLLVLPELQRQHIFWYMKHTGRLMWCESVWGILLWWVLRIVYFQFVVLYRVAVCMEIRQLLCLKFLIPNRIIPLLTSIRLSRLIYVNCCWKAFTGILINSYLLATVWCDTIVHWYCWLDKYCFCYLRFQIFHQKLLWGLTNV